MLKVKPPEWGAKVHKDLFELRMPKTQFAKLLGVNYTEMCNVISGYRISPNMQKNIIEKIDMLKKLKELEAEE